MTTDAAGARPRPPTAHRVAAVVGFLGHLAVLPVFLVSGLAAPPWAVVMLLTVWASLLALGLVWWRGTPVRVLLLPVLAAAAWLATMFFGDLVLGWTA